MKFLKLSILPFRNVVVFLMVMVTFSCSDLPNQTSQTPYPQNSSDVALHYFGQTLARAMANEPSLRAFIKAEVLKQFDGDYDMLYQYTKDRVVTKDKTLRQILLQNANDSDYFDALTEENLDINIKVPIVDGTSAEFWDTQNFAPLTVIRDKSIRKEISKQFTAYNGNEEVTKVSAYQAPKHITVVVELSERIHIKNSSSIKQDVASGIALYKTDPATKHEMGEHSSVIASQKNARLATCDRDPYTNIRQRLRSVTIKSNAWNRVATDQDWAEGGLEVHATFIYAASPDATDFSTQETVATGRIKGVNIYNPNCDRIRVYEADQSFGVNNDLIKWDKSLSGDTWKIVFIEKDGGNFNVEKTVSFTTGFEFSFTDPITGKLTASKTASKTIKYSDDDDELGEVFLYYCDPLWQDKEYSDFKFSMGVESDPYYWGNTVTCRGGTGPR